MRKWLLGAICATVIVAVPQSAGAFKDGYALLEAADSENVILNLGFTMYVAGVAAGARDVTDRRYVLGLPYQDEREPDHAFCAPAKITYQDLADTVRVWLRSQPKLQDLPSAWAIIEALAERFPCKS